MSPSTSSSKLDALLLTHGHYDHFGGMVGFLAAHKDKLKPGLPFYLGGEECFCSRETGPVNTPSNFGALNRRAIADAGLQVLFAERPSLFADHGFTTGYIPLASFEKPAQPSRMRIGRQPDGVIGALAVGREFGVEELAQGRRLFRGGGAPEHPLEAAADAVIHRA